MTAHPVLVELYRHTTWATLELLALCRSLDPDELEATTPGVYGSVRDTLGHLVASEEAYYARAVGEPAPPPMGDDELTLDEFAARIGRLGPLWEALLAEPELAEREVTSSDGWRFPAFVYMAQAIHHADDHRTQVLSILGSLGHELPDLAVWGHAEATGLMRPAPDSTAG